MITIHHNFDETKFKWLWARYVKAGNIAKHCVNSIPGVYSRKFSGASNHDLLSQPIIDMDEVADGTYEAIYFCGVLKKGYLNKNPEKNNYRHNVHFAVIPEEGTHDVWDFENWHVEIENGKLERIPATYELGDKFFKEPYTSHYYTCRIFRWMVGHFFKEELRDLKFGLPEYIEVPFHEDHIFSSENIVKAFIQRGYEIAQYLFENPNSGEELDPWITSKMIKDSDNVEKERNNILSKGLFDRYLFLRNCNSFYHLYFDTTAEVKDNTGTLRNIDLHCLFEGEYIDEVLANGLATIGVNEFLDTIAPYEYRGELLDPRQEYDFKEGKYRPFSLTELV